MTATAFTVVTTAAAGALLTAAGAVDASNGNSFDNASGTSTLEVTNGSGGAITISFVTQGVYTAQGGTQYPIADLNVSLANATTRVYGPFDKQLFNDGGGLVQVTWSSGTSVTARVRALGTA